MAFIFLVNAFYSFSQNSEIDSLQRILRQQNSSSHNPSLNDSIRINTLARLSHAYLVEKDFSTSMKYARISQNMAEKLVKINKSKEAKQFYANSFMTVAETFKGQEDFSNALKQYKKELALREETGDKKQLAICLNNIGSIYNLQDNYSLSLEYSFKALQMMELASDKREIARIYNNIGIAYDKQGNTDKALEYYKKELEEGIKLKDRTSIATGYTNIGTVYAQQGKFDDALAEFNKFLNMAKEDNNNIHIAKAFLNIANIYDIKGEYAKALETHSKALKIFEEVGSRNELALSNLNIGYLYVTLLEKNIGNKNHNATQAKLFLDKAMLYYEKGGQINGISSCYDALSYLEELKGNHKNSLNYYKNYIRFKDSVVNQENTAKSVRAEMNYEFDKKESASNLEQEKKEVIAKQENEKQKSIRNLFIIAFAFMLVLAVFIFRGYHQKRKINRLISYQKSEVEEQKSLVEKNQKQIIDSINYAKRIQSSILSNDNILKKAFPESFIFYSPKDIVSGDFYWFYSIPNTTETIVVVADCTGHGVPGAFLSMVGSTLLNEIVGHKNITDPAGIIKALNVGLSTTLVTKHKEETHSDGMDISICKIDSVTRRLLFAGANQSIYLVEGNNLEKIESQINSINGVFDLLDNANFASIEKHLTTGTCLFMSTDGYADQIGEETRKKFLNSRFEKLMVNISQLSASAQCNEIENAYQTWKGNQKQIDDILVIGIKV